MYGRGRSRGAGRGRGRGHSINAPWSKQSAPCTPSPPELDALTLPPTPLPVVALSRDVEQRLILTASASTDVPGSQEVEHDLPSVDQPRMQQLPPESSKAMVLPVRPGFGSVGQRVIVKANHFLVQVADQDLTHYDVAITPEVASKKACRRIMVQLLECHGSDMGERMLAYDGRKNAYSTGELPFTSKDFVVKLVDKDKANRREREFKVSIKFASKADLYHLQQFLHGRQLDFPQETIQLLDVVLRANPSNNNYVAVGRSFFSPKLGEKGELGGGLEYWKGFYQSLRPTQMGLSLNIDMSARAFFEPILVSEYVAKYLNRELRRPLSHQDRIMLKRNLRGVKVELNHQQHVQRYKISGISIQPIQQLVFPVDNTGANISAVQYFHQKYNIELKYPFLPAVQAGSDSKPTYLPMELCKIVEGQRYSKSLNERQINELLKATCQRPKERQSSIIKMVGYNNYNGDELIQKFGIQVMAETTSIEARVLPAPMLRYHATGRESHVKPRVGQWNMMNKKMFAGGKVEFWTCVNFSRSGIDANRFCNSLISICCGKGMDFSTRPLIPIHSANPGEIEKALFDIHAKASSRLAGKQLQLLIVILPDVSGNYGKIKRICETELGIVSQCCQPKKASRYNIQYMENVCLKINAKVGGINTVLEQAMSKEIPFLSDRCTIVFGADVTHPPPAEDHCPSIAAVVASMDWPHVTKYRALVSAQAHREEIIQDLYAVKQDPKRGTVHTGMIRELLLAFYESNAQQRPERIIFYRDGVSEGQFNQVLLHEMDAIRKACISFHDTYLPRVTYVVVQKRHHTRLFPSNHGDQRTTDKSGNILPGTVVDTKICHPYQFDFYLCSHAGIQGTSRPTHYHVLYDENDFTADALQSLTNNLCYTCARCTRSISIVPPAYYAHLAAFRARYYIEDTDTSNSGLAAEGGVRVSRERNLEIRPLPRIQDNVKDVMFYC